MKQTLQSAFAEAAQMRLKQHLFPCPVIDGKRLGLIDVGPRSGDFIGIQRGSQSLLVQESPRALLIERAVGRMQTIFFAAKRYLLSLSGSHAPSPQTLPRFWRKLIATRRRLFGLNLHGL